MHLPVEGRPDHVRAGRSIEVRIDTRRSIDPPADPLPDGAAYRSAPMLAVIEIDRALVIAVGRCTVIATPHRTAIVAHVRGLWRSSPTPVGPRVTGTGPRHWRGQQDLGGAVPALADWVASVATPVSGDGEDRATRTAKALAELTRDTVTDVRALRYELEGNLSATIQGESHSRLDAVLADLVELSVIVGRAQDEARDGLREGMGAWRTAASAYHAQRRRMDPSLPRRAGRRRAEALTWFPVYDAGVRQCAAAEHLLGQELLLLQGRLSAASTVAVARDAQAQESLTLLATVGGVALGVPGVIVGLYGVSNVLPLGWDSRSLAVITPIALASLLATALAFATTSGGWVRKARRAGTTLAAVLALVLFIAFAGYSFPAN